METDEFVPTYRRFASLIGAQHWHDRVAQMEAAIRGCPLLEDYLRGENQIAYALDGFGRALSEYGSFMMRAEAARTLYPAMSFAGQVLSMVDLYGPVKGDEFRRRATDALTNPDAMRGLRLEMVVATHFQRRGFVPDWPEQNGTGTFDLFVQSLGPEGLEVECKAISEDKGRRIHREEALRFANLLVEEELDDGLTLGLGVVLTLPGKLPTGHADRVALARAVKRQVDLRTSARLADGTEIHIEPFDMALLDGFNPTDLDAAEELIQQVTRTQNRHGMLIGSKDQGAIAFAMQSAKDDTFLAATFNTLKDAAKRQLTKTRPGLLVAGFDGVDGDQLSSIARQDDAPAQRPTGLPIQIQPFLGSANRDHVVCVAFVSRSALIPREDGSIDSGGAAYHFFNHLSPRWSEEFRGIFRPISA